MGSGARIIKANVKNKSLEELTAAGNIVAPIKGIKAKSAQTIKVEVENKKLHSRSASPIASPVPSPPSKKQRVVTPRSTPKRTPKKSLL